MTGKLATFKRGGVHPNENKELCDSTEYSVMPNPEELVIALSQHLGAPAKPVVKNRDTVEAEQLVAESNGFVSANIHTPLPGTIRGIDKVHLGPVNSASLTVKVDPEAAQVKRYEDNPEPLNLKDYDPKEIVGKIKDAGLVGMGGATFPTHVKLSPPPGVQIDTIIINGAECEPYLTADDCMMRNHPVQIVEGTRAVMHATGVKRGFIGLEDNKPESYKALLAATENVPEITILRMKTRYPQGSEKQLIEAAVSRRVAPGQLPFTQGVVVQNTSTVAGVYEMLKYNRPLTRRLISVTGRAVANPQNVLVPTGTSIQDLLAFCGGLKEELAQVVLGGPMMGRATTNLNEPTIKGTSGVLFLSHAEVELTEEQPCLRCGKCVSACPMGLVPTELLGLSMNNRFEEAKDALDCIECGTCAYICPSNRRLVHWIRLAKWELARMRRRAQLKEQEATAKAEAN